MPEGQCPHPRHSYGRCVNLEDAADNSAVRQYIVIFIIPLARRARGPGRRAGAFLSVTGTPGTYPASFIGDVTLRAPILRAPKSASKLGSRIVPDPKWPGMCRVRLPDGTLSDMVSLTRAKDALAERG